MKKTFQIILLSFLLCGLALVLPGCRTQKGFNRTADNNKDWLAEKCEKEFPIDTSVQSNTDTTHADNKDYSKTIDSLRSIAENALNQVKIDTVYSEKECNDLLQKQAKTISSLSSSLEALRASYKPCVPSYIKTTKTYTVKDSREIYKAEKKSEELEGKLARMDIWNKVLLGALLIAVALIFILKR